MKKLIILVLIIFLGNYSFGFDYTEEDKKMFYDAFLNGYIDGMTDSISSSTLSQEKKEKFLTEFKKQINKDELIDFSWACIKKYPVTEIVSAALVCTSGWIDIQAARNKKLLDGLN